MSTTKHVERVPLQQVWPQERADRYQTAGYWRGETFPGFLRERARDFADDVAVVGGDTRWTYAQLWQESERIAAGLIAQGLQPGDRAILQLGNIPEFIATACALFRAHIIPVYALPDHRIAEIAHFAHTAEASGYITTAKDGTFDYRELARQLQEQAPAIEQVVIAGEAQEFTALDALKGDTNTLPDDPDPQAVAFLQASGGSTGLPKLIPRTHDDYIYSFRASNDICGITRDSVYMVALPVAHNFPMSSPGFFGALYAGARVVLTPAPGPDTAFPLVEREGVTCVGLVTPLALLWAEAAPKTSHDLSSLKTVQVGGAKLVPEAAKRVIDGLDCTLQQVFGMAEGLVNYTRLDDPEEAIINTQGRPISPDDDVLIVDDDGHEVADGHNGHLLVRGPYTLNNYHNNAKANEESFTAEGYYMPGDIVQRRSDGNLVVQGRAKDHINRAGEKISAEEIEDHLLANTKVFDACVVSIPDDYLGERSCAFVIPGDDKPRSVELKKWTRERGLAAFKVPDQVVFVDSFDTTAVGKVNRRELRTQLREHYLANQDKT